jgi:hypothetical protein
MVWLRRSCWFFLCVRKSIKVFKKGMLSLDFFWIRFGLSLDLVTPVAGHGPIKSEDPASWPGLFGFAY